MDLEDLKQRFPWYPTIDYALCTSDLDCLNYCPAEVFEWDKETGRPVVAHPQRCIPGCDICLRGCVTGALTLPGPREMREALRRLRTGI